LPAENNIETGMDESDVDDLKGKEKLGDTVIN
jgi:hypothetical protein